MSKHTPAPWNDNDVYGNIWHEDELNRKAVVEGSGNGLAINNDADRDLILSAPDMYEALEKISDLLAQHGDWHGAYDLVLDALKKARGEA